MYHRDKNGDITCCNCDANIEDEVNFARREGMIAGLERALEVVRTDDPKDAWAELSIRAEIERLKGEA